MQYCNFRHSNLQNSLSVSTHCNIFSTLHISNIHWQKSVVSEFLSHLFTLHKFHGSSSYHFIAHNLISFGQTTLVKYNTISAGIYATEHNGRKTKTMLSELPLYSCPLISNEVLCSAWQLCFSSVCTLPLSTSYQ